MPPNTTAHLQPCDTRIINLFKAHYRKLYLQCVLEAMDAGKEISCLNIKEAIDFTAEAWKNVTSQTIINCWQKTEIVPVDEWAWPSSDVHSKENVGLKIDIEELITSISSLNTPVMTAEEYIRIDDSLGIEEVILDEEAIVEEILQKSDPDDSNEDSEIEVEKIPHSITFEQCKLLLQYTEQQDPIKFVEEPDLLTL